MGLLDDLNPPSPILNCKVRTILQSLDDKDRAILEEALANLEAWKTETLAVALTKRGLTINSKTLSRHRLGQCSCSKI
jgi:hypothetical protein